MKRDGGFEIIEAEYPASTPEYWMRRLQDGREEWRCLENTLSDLRSELAALREDKAILDWLMHSRNFRRISYVQLSGSWVLDCNYAVLFDTLRDAARDAMKGEK